MRVNGLVVVLLLSAILSGCNKFNKLEQIPKDELVKVLVDIHLADGTLTAKGYKVKQDSIVLHKYYNYIFLKHNTSPSAFQNTLKYYTKHPDQLDLIYVKVMEQLTTIESQIKEKVIDPQKK